MGGAVVLVSGRRGSPHRRLRHRRFLARRLGMARRLVGFSGGGRCGLRGVCGIDGSPGRCQMVLALPVAVERAFRGWSTCIPCPFVRFYSAGIVRVSRHTECLHRGICVHRRVSSAGSWLPGMLCL